MKVSRLWLEKFFDVKLPSTQEIADALTFHAFEIEAVERHGEDEELDVKITPNRGHDCLSHRGLATEIATILNIKLLHDPFSLPPNLTPTTDRVRVTIEDRALCPRYIAAYIKGVRVGPSPSWLKERLEAIGERSINNIVDTTNFVMFNTGQPLHAFDAGKLTAQEGRFGIGVRKAQKGEKLRALDLKEYSLSESMLVIEDGNSKISIGIAGVKGGEAAGITDTTQEIIIESANFESVSVRKTSQALKLRTSASERFEQGLSTELAAHGIRSVVDMILKLAGGECVGFVDEYPQKQKPWTVSVSVGEVKRLLGDSFGEKEVIDTFTRLGFKYLQTGEVFKVSIPFERLDLMIPEDLVEEVGRIVGYENVPSTPLPPFSKKPEINKIFYWSERVREFLVSEGYSEVLTSVFSDTGERSVLNKVGGERPYLRSFLASGLEEALKLNSQNIGLLGVTDVRLFEIGSVFSEDLENTHIAVCGADASEVMQKMYTTFRVEGPKPKKQGLVVEEDIEELIQTWPEPTSYDDLPVSTTDRYKPFSRYPFIVRDIALWVPTTTQADEVRRIIAESAGPLMTRIDLFDEFKKGTKVSYAFRLVFQSYEKTLSDAEVNEIIGNITEALEAHSGFEVR